MSYELKLDPKQRAGARFIGSVRKALIGAALDEKEKSGINQQDIANRIGVNRSVINRLLRGKANLTLRTVAEIAWALGYTPKLVLERKPVSEGSNHEDASRDFGSGSGVEGTTQSHDNFITVKQPEQAVASSRTNKLEFMH